MQILGLLGMYFDAVVVEFDKYLLLFRLALTILCMTIQGCTIVRFVQAEKTFFTK